MTRKATLTGGAFTVLLIAAVLTMRNFEFLPSYSEALTFFEEGGRTITWGAFLGGFAGFSLVWFGAVLTNRIRNSSSEAFLAIGGAVFAAVAMALGFMFLAAGAERTVLGGGIPPEVAAILYDLGSISVGNAAPFGFAALTAAVALAGRGHFPTWFVWVSGLLTIGLVSPVNYAVAALILPWVPAAGVFLDRATETVAGAVR